MSRHLSNAQTARCSTPNTHVRTHMKHTYETHIQYDVADLTRSGDYRDVAIGLLVWVMSHQSLPHPCHPPACVMSYMWTRHVIHMNASCHICSVCVLYVYNACPSCMCVVSCMWRRHLKCNLCLPFFCSKFVLAKKKFFSRNLVLKIRICWLNKNFLGVTWFILGVTWLIHMWENIYIYMYKNCEKKISHNFFSKKSAPIVLWAPMAPSEHTRNTFWALKTRLSHSRTTGSTQFFSKKIGF